MAARKAAEASARAEQTRSAAPTILTVSQLAASIDSTLRGGFATSIRVVGEVSGCRERTHWYFDIKDENAVINCVMFASQSKRSPATPANGAQVVVKGRVEYYAKQGRVTIVVESLEPVGEGALDLALRKLVEEARALGWLDPARKRPLPKFPRKIAVVTSRSAAALQDVLVTLRRRCPSVAVLLVDVRVQGDCAAEEISSAVREVSRRAVELGVDAMLVTRGGGSKEDLWCFNTREVAEAIVGASIPVVAAIGHETDTTLAELVADERCATPTQAAMRLSPDTVEIERLLGSMQGRLEAQVVRLLAHDRRRLESSAARPLFRDPRWIVEEAESLLGRMGASLTAAARSSVGNGAQAVALLAAKLERHRPRAVHAAQSARLESLRTLLQAAAEGVVREIDIDGDTGRLQRSIVTTLRQKHERLHALERELRAVAPLRVLERGFSVTRKADGTLVRSAQDVRDGDALRTLLSDGEVRSVAGSGSPAKPASRKKADEPSGGGLFGG